ncbi:DNA-directed RNA polymerase sigma 28 domain protein, partial [Chlamydia psittaci 06-1683]
MFKIFFLFNLKI